LHTAVEVEIETREDVATRRRSSGELDDKRRKYVTTVLLSGIPEIAVKICNRG